MYGMGGLCHYCASRVLCMSVLEDLEDIVKQGYLAARADG